MANGYQSVIFGRSEGDSREKLNIIRGFYNLKRAVKHNLNRYIPYHPTCNFPFLIFSDLSLCCLEGSDDGAL
jgi:hypothetical protein